MSLLQIGSVGLVLALAGTAMPAAAEPLKIAVIETLSGPGSTTTRLFAAATKYWIGEFNAKGGWKGSPVEYAEYDNQGSASVAAEKLAAAIGDGAHVIVNSSSSAVAGQVTEDVRKHNLRNPGRPVLYINSASEAMELTGEKCHFYFFRFATNAEIRVKAMVAAMKADGALGTKVFSINQNYSWGKDVESVTKRYESLGGYRVTDAVLHEVNKIQDFTPYVARIAASGADTVITGNWGSDLLLLFKAVSSAGLKVRFGATFIDLPGNLASAGETALGYYTVQDFNAEAGGEAGEALSEAYRKKVGTVPTSAEIRTIAALRMFEAALAAVDPGSKVDVTKIALALEKVEIRTPMGAMTMRAKDHQVLVPVVVSQVSKEAKFKVDGTNLGFKPLKLIPGSDAVNAVQESCKMNRPT